MEKVPKIKILKSVEKKGDAIRAPTIGMQIEAERGVKDYPDCIMTVREGKRK